MKKILVITLLSMVYFMGAQTKDASAVKLLNSVSSSYNKPTHLAFTYTLKNSDAGVSQKESGNVYISGNKYNLSLMNTTQVYDGKKVYSIDSEAKEVTITSNPDEEDLMTPTKVLNSYKTGYNIKSSGTKKVNGINASIITMTPTGSSNTSKVEIAIDSSRKNLIKVTEYSKQGSVTTITITSTNKNAIVPKAMFTFNRNYYKSKGYYITEL